MPNQIEIELHGPSFTQSAIEISQRVSLKSIARLLVYNMTADSVKALEGALQKLSGYLSPEGVVIITTSQAVKKGTKSILKAAAGVSVVITQSQLSLSTFFNNANSYAADDPSAATISGQMAADGQKQQAERWKIMQETQNKIFEITQDVTVNKARTADKAFQAMDGYIRN